MRAGCPGCRVIRTLDQHIHRLEKAVLLTDRAVDPVNDGSTQEARVRRFGAAAVLLLAGAMPALADDLPRRKPGLWEVTTNLSTLSGIDMTSQICLDAATDRMTMLSTGPLATEACPKIDVQRSGDTVTIDASCTLAGKPATSHVVITGSFDSAVTMTATSQSEALPGGKMIIMTAAKRLGPCAADQKPGDMIINGVKMNILEMRKQGPSEGVPLPR
jgi:Protein of unknown function (DUF3617)